MRRPTSRVSIALSRSLRHHLEEAREKSGRTLTGEIEARLRASLRTKSSDCLILLQPDFGLMAWLTAFAETDLFRRGFEEVMIDALRDRLIKSQEKDPHRALAMIARLPSSLREANEGRAKHLETRL